MAKFYGAFLYGDEIRVGWVELERKDYDPRSLPDEAPTSLSEALLRRSKSEALQAFANAQRGIARLLEKKAARHEYLSHQAEGMREARTKTRSSSLPGKSFEQLADKLIRWELLGFKDGGRQ